MSDQEEEKKAKELRDQAEKIVQERQHNLAYSTPTDLQSLLHELQVHQEELIIQNEELRSTQLELVETRDQYADLYHNAPLGYCTINKRGKILEANQTLATLLYVNHAQITKHRLSDFIPAEEQDQFYLHLQHVLEQSTNHVFDLQMIKQNGERMVARLEALLDRHNPEHVRIVLSDNTERKQAQLAIEGYARDLERVNQTLKDFSFIASHDLREPLRKVKAFGSLLSSQFENQLGPQGQDYIQRMTSAVGRMDAMIQGLLAYSQVTSKGAPLKNVPLRQVVMEVVTDLEVHISHVNGRIMVHELPTIQADELQMRILFQNLISNALKYHRPEVPPVITITSRKPVKDQSVILVQDNGIGIDMKYADFIFEPFSRLNGKPEYEGTGMGLTICQKIMERHNGAISVTSTPGEGSVFILTFPRGAPNAAV